MTKPQTPVQAFKGFDKDLKCRGFQYAVGETFTTDGDVVRCGAGGFHSCEFPLDVFSHYPPADSRFAIVQASGKIAREQDGDTKIASASLTVQAELALPALITHAVDWLMAWLDKSIAQTVVPGDQSAATNTGTRSAATNTGYQSAATNTGYQSAATNTGDQSAATNTGYRSAATVSGAESVAASLGIQGKAKAAAGGAIVLCHRDDSGALLHIRASKVGENGVKADTFYVLDANGEFEECAS